MNPQTIGFIVVFMLYLWLLMEIPSTSRIEKNQEKTNKLLEEILNQLKIVKDEERKK